MRRNLLITLAACQLSLPGLLGAGQHDVHRHHGEHVHGAASLTVAAEDEKVQIELNSPAVNIVGFEHAPETRGEQHAMGVALAQLRQSTLLFGFPQAARCQTTGADIGAPQATYGDSNHNHGHGHGGEHSDIRAQYRFRCAKPDRLDWVDINLFTAFPGIEEIDAQFVTESRQGAVALKPGSKRIQLR